MTDLDLVRRFLAQLRTAFMQAVPRPVFKLEMVRMGRYKVVGVERMRFDEVPIIPFPETYTEALMEPEFQEMVNKSLRMRPAVLTGRSDVTAWGKVIAENVAWRGTVSRVKMMVQEGGVIRIEDFE